MIQLIDRRAAMGTGHRVGYLPAAQVLIERRCRNNRHGVEVTGWPIAFVGPPDQLVGGTERRDDVGRRRQQRHDPHHSYPRHRFRDRVRAVIVSVSAAGRRLTAGALPARHRARLDRTAPRECPTRIRCSTLEPVARQRELAAGGHGKGVSHEGPYIDSVAQVAAGLGRHPSARPGARHQPARSALERPPGLTRRRTARS